MKEGLPVHGYTPQTDERVKLVNANKQFEERLLRKVDAIADAGEVDLRWLALARTHFEQGMMALNRAIFQPQRITLPDDPE